LSTKTTPAGSEPVSLNDGFGAPVEMTVNEADWPTVKVVVFPLVIVGADVDAELTVKANVWLALLPTPLLAFIVNV
jgi:hypothetical protein